MSILSSALSELFSRRWLRFALVGTIGFLVDALVLATGYHWLGLGALLARAISFTVAVLVTWQLNRRFTFAASNNDRSSGELLRYLGTNLAGLTVNAVVYALIVTLLPWAEERPIIALIPASLLAAFINYRASADYVFNTRKRA